MRGQCKFERRHFKFLAETLRTIADPTARRLATDHFCRELHSTNPNFDEDRFAKAAGWASKDEGFSVPHIIGQPASGDEGVGYEDADGNFWSHAYVNGKRVKVCIPAKEVI